MIYICRAPFQLVVRSYLGYCAGSHQTSEAKRLWARIVLEWVTFREVLVTNPSLLLFCFIVCATSKCIIKLDALFNVLACWLVLPTSLSYFTLLTGDPTVVQTVRYTNYT